MAEFLRTQMTKEEQYLLRALRDEQNAILTILDEYRCHPVGSAQAFGGGLERCSHESCKQFTHAFLRIAARLK